MPKNEIGFPLLATYEIIYKEEKIKVEVIELNMPVPTEYYFVYLPWGQAMLRRFPLRDKKDFWLGGNSHLSFEEAKELGVEIEKQTGKTLSSPESSNPFKYKGSIPIIFYSSQLGEMVIKEAKSPFNDSIYYEIHMGTRTITLVESALMKERIWSSEENLREEDFELFKSIIIDAKKKMPWVAD